MTRYLVRLHHALRGWGGLVVRWWRGSLRAMAAVVALTVAGCAYVDGVVDSRYDTINRSAARARNEAILLNIARASRNAPLNFVAFSQISGSTSANIVLAAPDFGIGPGAGSVFGISNSTANTSSNLGNSFDVTVLNSKDFYTALLSPVDLPTLSFFIHQGYSRQLLFWLFTEAVRMRIGGHTIEVRNQPNGFCNSDKASKHFCFKDMVIIALASGLTAETKIVKTHNSGSDKSHTTIYGRFCFDPVLANRAKREYGGSVAHYRLLARTSEHRPLCDAPTWHLKTSSGSTDRLTFDLRQSRYGPVHFEIVPRSTFAIYQFLGRILAAHASNEFRMLPRKGDASDTRILTVTHDSSQGCFIATSYEGETYCVPLHGAEHTKRVFSLLAQLLALKTQTKDLAITPTVRTLQ